MPPFRLDLTAWALRRRAINRTDRWDGATYRRTVHLPGGAAELAVTQEGPAEDPLLRVRVVGVSASAGRRRAVTTVLERALGLRIDLEPFYAMAARDVRLDALATRFRGMKPPRFPSVFEALVNAMSCQQISLHAGLSLINRLLAAYGAAAAGAPADAYAFPRPEDLHGADIPALRALGYSRQKSLAILDLAGALAEQRIDLEPLEHQDDAAACRSLVALRGIGRWSAEYVLLRGLGRLHVFPGDDVGARNNLQKWLNLPEALDYAGVNRIVRSWQPYAGLAYLHLLLKGLAEAGAIAEPIGG